MSLFKWLAGIVVGLIVIILLAAVLIPMFVDPNDYRQEISTLVKDNTGRDLDLAGELKISVFPWLGIKTEGMRFSQPEQIGGDMVAVESAQLRLKLMPLLGQKLEIDTIVLEQPRLNLITLEDGTSSFTGLAGETEEPATSSESNDEASAVALVVQGVEVTGANLLWDDRQAGQKYEIKDFNLLTGNLLGGSFAPIELSGSVVDASNPTPIELALNGEAKINPNSLVAELQGLKSSVVQGDQKLQLAFDNMRFDQASGVDLSALTLNANVVVPATEGEADAKAQIATLAVSIENLDYQLAENPGQAAVSNFVVDGSFDDRPFTMNIPSIAANVDKQTAVIDSLTLSSGDLNLALSDLVVTQFVDNPNASGRLTLSPFNAAQLLRDLAIDYQPGNTAALQAVGLDLTFNGGPNAMAVENLAVKLDDSNLTGRVALTDIASLATEFDLVLDSLNVDDYLPVSDETAQQELVSDTPEADALAIPLSAFEGLNLNGSFKAKQLVSAGLKLTDIDVNIASKNGQLTVTPKVNLYDGSLDGAITYDQQNNSKSLRIANQVDLVSLGNMLIDADVTDQLSGLGSLDIDVTVTETNGVQSNEGVIKLLAKNGAIKGIDIKGMIDSAYNTVAQLSGQKQDTQEGQSAANDETRFAELLGTFYLKDYRLTNDDFQMKAPLFRISGNGEIDIAQQNINYLVKVTVVNSTDGQGGKAAEELAGLTIPIRLRGALTEPGYSLDMKALYTSLAKRELNKRKDNFIKDKLGISLGKDKSKDGDEKEDVKKKLLKGLFRK